MRSFVGAALFYAATLSACAAVSGLDGYTPTNGDGSVNVQGHGGSSGAGSDDATAFDAPGATDDASGNDAPTDPADTSAPEDTSTEVTDAKADAPPPCTTATCNGCCGTDGLCHGGSSVTTCGKGGAACKDCTSMGGACNSGTCGTAPKDASAPAKCAVASCPVCSVAIYTSCCKSDNTCGCQWTAFAPCG